MSFRTAPAWAQEVIGTVKDAAERSTLAARAQGLLSGLVPQPQQGQGKDTAEGSTQMKEGQYLLWGELFEKGRTHAVVDLSEHIALADWDATKAAWTVRQVIKAPIYWKYPGFPQAELDVTPDDLPTRPFWVKQLSSTAPRLLVISTGYTRYHAARFIFVYDTKTHQLDADDGLYSVAEPVLREGHVVLTDDSGRKAWWGEDSFYQVEKGRLHFRGSLREGSYRGDDSHIHVTFLKPGSPEEITWRFNATAEDQSTYKIRAGEEGPDEEKAPVIGHIRFRESGADSPENWGAFLLHKLTGLPSSVANPNPFVGTSSETPAPPLTDRDVELTGNAEVLRLLGPGKAAAKPEGKGK
ncbi:hypothetical protein [Roseimicrobium sp. ORNL1]|uniref:hypothetical protein n=1 Tax=Roseimicrobium sp. ORNL1 TaxID=2711231 RepID=UPI0013E0EF4E|nr:hypothetical protein [Roseimicrobium sp. ORNL1]QIF04267.1 hypothetical protein G5S37_23000 [Roseimicrobium sp. ORNL1]